MYRRYYSRNPRNRGIKVKQALKICVFLTICFWLIYQIKRSHDKNKEFEEIDANDSMESGSVGGLIKIGRKDVRPLYEQQRNQAAEEGEITEVEDVNNHEEDRSPEKKVEEGNGALRVEDDEADGHEIDKSDKGVDRKEDHITDESRDDGGHDGGGKSSHEAHEELYKADDHTQTTENENKLRRINGHLHENILELENNDLAASNSPTDVSTQNVTESVHESDNDEGTVTEGTIPEESNFKTEASDSNLDVGNHLSYSNSTDHTESINPESDFEDFSKPSSDADSFSDTDSFTVVRISRSEANTQENETIPAKSVSGDVTDGVLESAFADRSGSANS